MQDTSMSQLDAARFERERARLTSISSRIVGSHAEAEDIVQDCFIRWQASDRAGCASAAAWLTTVVKHLSIDRLRKRAREAIAAESAASEHDDAASPEQAWLIQAALGDALARLITTLSPTERLALVLHEVLDCPHADIAAALGTSTANARQLLARARRRLQSAPESDYRTKLSRELIRRFQAAIQGVDVPAMVSLLGEEQPMAVHDAPPTAVRNMRHGHSANDGCYLLAA